MYNNHNHMVETAGNQFSNLRPTAYYESTGQKRKVGKLAFVEAELDFFLVMHETIHAAIDICRACNKRFDTHGLNDKKMESAEEFLVYMQGYLAYQILNKYKRLENSYGLWSYDEYETTFRILEKQYNWDK